MAAAKAVEAAARWGLDGADPEAVGGAGVVGGGAAGTGARGCRRRTSTKGMARARSTRRTCSLGADSLSTMALGGMQKSGEGERRG